MAVSMADITKLRKMTGAGMMDCKNALTESEGDFDKAVEIIRKKGHKGIKKRHTNLKCDIKHNNNRHTLLITNIIYRFKKSQSHKFTSRQSVQGVVLIHSYSHHMKALYYEKPNSIPYLHYH